MLASIDDLLRRYELGTMSRRELLSALALLAVRPAAPPSAGILAARGIGHLNVRVSDVARSEAFYRGVFGLPPARPVVGAAVALDLPAGGFISLCPVSVGTCGAIADARPGQIDHFCLGIDDFDARRAAAALVAAGHEATVTDGPSVFLEDPDGAAIQLSSMRQSFALPGR